MEKITSKDGTQIAYEKVGNGPAVILVEGASGSRGFGFSEGMSKLLSPDFTVYWYDRRGRGDSTDTQPYSVDREIEDIEALIDKAGGAAYVYGISSGACLALEAAIKLGDKIKKLALYEAPYDSSEEGQKIWREYTANLEKAIAENRRGDAVVLFMKLVLVPDEMIDGMKSSPMWSYMESIAPTLVYDAQCMGEDRGAPVERAKQVTAKTLIMDGSKSLEKYPFMSRSAEELAKAIPNSERKTVEGQGHDVSSEVLAPVLRDFFKDD